MCGSLENKKKRNQVKLQVITAEMAAKDSRTDISVRRQDP